MRFEVRGSSEERRILTSSLAPRTSNLICVSLHECDLIDFAQGGFPLAHFLQSRSAQEGHPFLVGRLLDLRGGAAVENHAANTIGEVEKFRDGGAAVEPGAEIGR